MSKCEYCGLDRPFRCHNTRDMECFAIDGDEPCLEQLELLGGGESGLRYVVLNRAEALKRRAEAG